MDMRSFREDGALFVEEDHMARELLLNYRKLS